MLVAIGGLSFLMKMMGGLFMLIKLLGAAYEYHGWQCHDSGWIVLDFTSRWSHPLNRV
jgi:threonine/homoserine/homoserine lactone efflux protein